MMPVESAEYPPDYAPAWRIHTNERIIWVTVRDILKPTKELLGLLRSPQNKVVASRKAFQWYYDIGTPGFNDYYWIHHGIRPYLYRNSGEPPKQPKKRYIPPPLYEENTESRQKRRRIEKTEPEPRLKDIIRQGSLPNGMESTQASPEIEERSLKLLAKDVVPPSDPACPPPTPDDKFNEYDDEEMVMVWTGEPEDYVELALHIANDNPIMKAAVEAVQRGPDGVKHIRHPELKKISSDVFYHLVELWSGHDFGPETRCDDKGNRFLHWVDSAGDLTRWLLQVGKVFKACRLFEDVSSLSAIAEKLDVSFFQSTFTNV